MFAAAGVAILIGLGIWQLDRKVWKENLIATLDTRLARAPQDLPPRENWPRLVAEDNEYTRVKFPAEFLAGQEALVYTAGSAFRPDVQGPGYWVFAPARLAGGSIVIVDRGFVPVDRKDPASRAQGSPLGIVDIVGVMRWPETRGLFTPADDPATNVWYLRDPKAIAAAKKWDTAAPFYIEQEIAGAARRLAASRASLRSICPTTICNTPSPGSASRSAWRAFMWSGSPAVCAGQPDGASRPGRLICIKSRYPEVAL